MSRRPRALFDYYEAGPSIEPPCQKKKSISGAQADELLIVEIEG
jgi:hypothetical protein